VAYIVLKRTLRIEYDDYHDGIIFNF